MHAYMCMCVCVCLSTITPTVRLHLWLVNTLSGSKAKTHFHKNILAHKNSSVFKNTNNNQCKNTQHEWTKRKLINWVCKPTVDHLCICMTSPFLSQLQMCTCNNYPFIHLNCTLCMHYSIPSKKKKHSLQKAKTNQQPIAVKDHLVIYRTFSLPLCCVCMCVCVYAHFFSPKIQDTMLDWTQCLPVTWSGQNCQFSTT